MTDYDGLAEYYDAEWQELKEDIPFLLEEAKKSGGPVLELACGTGRILVPFAEAGIEAWGIDNSTEMLNKLEKRIASLPAETGRRIQYRAGDMQNFSLGRTFGTIIIPFNSFLLITDRADFDACLKNCYEHLEENGTFIVDIFSPSFELCAIKEPKIQFLRHFYVPENNKVVIQWEYAQRDMANQRIEIDFLYEEYDPDGSIAKKTRHISMSLMFRYELHYLLEKHGFTVDRFYGNYDRSEFTDGSPQMIYVCRKQS